RPAFLALTGLGLLCIAAGLALAGGHESDEVRQPQVLRETGPSDGWRRDVANPSAAIDAYAGAQSVGRGESLALYVRSTLRYRIDIYRIGWYAGQGGSLVECLPACDATEDPH